MFKQINNLKNDYFGFFYFIHDYLDIDSNMIHIVSWTE